MEILKNRYKFSTKYPDRPRGQLKPKFDGDRYTKNYNRIYNKTWYQKIFDAIYKLIKGV